MKKSPVMLIMGGLLLLIFLMLLFAFQVRTTEIAVVTTFGRYSSAKTEPGLYFRLPLPIHKVYKFDKRLQNFERKFETTLTRDGKNLLSTIFVGWRISQPKIYLERFAGDPARAEAALENVVRNAKNAVIGQHDFSDLISPNPKDVKFEQIERRMLEEIKGTAESAFGLSVELVGIKQLGLPENITADVFKRMKAERERLSKRYIGEGESEARKITAEANLEREKLIAEAQGTATRILGQAQGEASLAYKSMEQDPQLAKFLIELRAIEASTKDRAVLIIDDKTPPFNLLREGAQSYAAPTGAKK